MYEMQLASVKSNKINLEPLFMLFFIGIIGKVQYMNSVFQYTTFNIPKAEELTEFLS